MGSFSGLGIGLSFLFSCIFMGLVAELYYLLCWKKRISTSTNPAEIEDFALKPNNPSKKIINGREEQVDLEVGSTKDNLDEEGIEAEIMRIHNLCGPPRFLFTINEESKDDLESEDGKSRRSSRTKSLSEFLLSDNHGFSNPLFECLSEAEVNRLRSSPPPNFKFLKDAEDKLIRNLLAERKRALTVQEEEQK